MNIYFACSITGGRRDEAVYRKLVSALVSDGHDVPTASLASPEVMALEDVVLPEEVYGRDIAWIETCDLLVAEISTPSHGVGYEIGFALGLGKPVLCLYRQGVRVSKMILGNRDPRLTVQAYKTSEEAIRFLRVYLTDGMPGPV